MTAYVRTVREYVLMLRYMSNQVSSAGPQARIVLYATLLAGLGGFGITISMANILGNDYANFAAFWAVYFVVLGALGGIQQETARATSLSTLSPSSRPFKHVYLMGLLITFVTLATMTFTFLFANQILRVSPLEQSLALIFGTALSVPSLIAGGALFGLKLWKPLSAFIILDVVIRWVLLLVVSVFTHDLAWLSWMVAVPSIITFALLLPVIRSTVGFDIALDSTFQQAAKNMFYATVAALGASVLINGVPAVLVAKADQEDLGLTAGLVFALIMTRAPLVVGSMALQSLYVVRFRDFPGARGRRAIVLGLAGLGLSLVLALASWVFGLPFLEAISGLEMRFSAEYLAGLTLTSVFTMWVVISGSFCLAASNHAFYALGWLVAAAVTISILLIPAASEIKLLVALTAGPLAGMSIHLVGHIRGAKENS